MSNKGYSDNWGAVKDSPGDILASFAHGADEGPAKSLSGTVDGLKSIWKLIQALPDPKARAQMSTALQNMSPRDKQAVVDGLSEAVGAGMGAAAGGTSGAAGGSLAFGLGAAPGAFAGGIAGAGLGGAAGRFVSRLVGHITNPEGVREIAHQMRRAESESPSPQRNARRFGRSVGVVGRAAKGILARQKKPPA